MKKILYLFSDTGGGHRSAATALIKAVEHEKGDEVHQEMVDVFAECSGFLNIFAKLYAPVIKYVPWFWGKLYNFLDDDAKLKQLEKMSKPFIIKQLAKMFKRKSPDCVVSVHPMVNQLTYQAMIDSGLDAPLITVITDPMTFHRAWIDPRVDMLIVATEEARKNAIKFGMPEEKIKVLGLPIDPAFVLKDKEKAEQRAKAHHLSVFFTVLLMGGGEGGGKMYKIVKALSDAKLKIQLIVIAGRNEKLEARLKKDADKFYFPIKVYGFTNEVPQLMSESDLVITKAGPGTISEALAMNLPVIITSWLPGQEEGNVEFVKTHDVGRVAKDPEKVAKIIKELQENRQEFEKMKKNIAKVRKPHASFDIARVILGYLK